MDKIVGAVTCKRGRGAGCTAYSYARVNLRDCSADAGRIVLDCMVSCGVIQAAGMGRAACRKGNSLVQTVILSCTVEVLNRAKWEGSHVET